MNLLKYLISNPIVLISLAILIIFFLFPPKKVNSWYGYRTVSSMKSEKSWNFAQKFSGKLSLFLMTLTLIAQCILFLLFGSSAITDLNTIAIWLLAMGILIIVTERKLKILNKNGYQQ